MGWRRYCGLRWFTWGLVSRARTWRAFCTRVSEPVWGRRVLLEVCRPFLCWRWSLSLSGSALRLVDRSFYIGRPSWHPFDRYPGHSRMQWQTTLWRPSAWQRLQTFDQSQSWIVVGSLEPPNELWIWRWLRLRLFWPWRLTSQRATCDLVRRLSLESVPTFRFSLVDPAHLGLRGPPVGYEDRSLLVCRFLVLQHRAGMLTRSRPDLQRFPFK